MTDMDGKKKLDAWLSDPDISLTLQGSPGACEALQDDLRSISDAYKAMEAECERLRTTLREMDCPRPCNHRPDDFTIGQCFDALECGCLAGVALGTRHEG